MTRISGPVGKSICDDEKVSCDAACQGSQNMADKIIRGVKRRLRHA